MRVLLRKALSQQRPIEVIYLDEKGLLTQRVIQVYHFDEIHLFGYCFLRREPRTFRLDRILAMTETGKKRSKKIPV